jgi:ankyrin repeat protein
MVVLLLSAGADVDARGDSRATPLHEAALHGSGAIAEALLKAGADIEAVGFRHNETALHVAAFHGHANVVKILLAHGAHANAQNMLQKAPLQLAQENQRTNVVALLLSPTPPSPDR